ncbi:MAG: tyrosine--tRNA ligase, partial [Candidatus Levybacteria bacterium]|nr:tyrosine--tRNA ligase [Candidatus Levybacteria bacterium]
TTILEGTDGRKMSKSWGNAIWLDDKPFDMFAKIMAIKDDLILNYFLLATDLSLGVVSKFEKKLKSGQNPRDIKKELAFEIVSKLYDEKISQKAKEEFEKTVQNKEIPKNIPQFTFYGEFTISEALMGSGIKSRSEGKRLIDQGAVTLNGKKIEDLDSLVSEGILKIGKKKFVKLVLK